MCAHVQAGDAGGPAGGSATIVADPEQNFDLTAALEAIRRRAVPPRMPPAGLKVRIKTSPWVRSLLPTRLLVKRAERTGQAMWERDAGKREYALAEMRTILAGTPRVEDLHELARRYLIEHQIASYGVLFWQQRWSAKVDPQSAARLRAALSGNRGVLLSTCHVGPFYRLQYAPPLDGRDTYFVAGSWFFEPPGPGAWG